MCVMVKIRELCLHCAKDILPNERKVVLITSQDKKEIERVQFHIICWKAYYQMQVMNTVNHMKNEVFKMISNPAISGILKNVQGVGFLTSILQNPERQHIEEIKNKIILTKKDGKAKRRRKSK